MHTNKNDLIDKLSVIGIRVLVTVSLLMGLLLILFGGYSIYEQLYTQNRAFSTGGLKTEEVQSIEAQENLATQNKDYRGWLQIDGTKINYPVMQDGDELYYAYHDKDGKSSLTGSIYMSAYNKADLSDDYIVIYGHHMDNGGMFGNLDKFLDKDFFDNHTGGTFSCLSGTYKLELWAVVLTDAYEDSVYDVGNLEFNEVVEFVNRYSRYIKPSALNNAKKIIALSTCRDTSTNGRLVVFFTLKEEPAPGTTNTETTPSDDNDNTPTGKPGTTGNGNTTPGDGDTTPDKPDTPKPDNNPDNPITPDEKDKDEDGKVDITDSFVPGGSSYGREAWALVNLICLIITVYILIPIFFLRKKYGRIHKMRKVNKSKEALFEAQDMSPEDWTERERIMRVATQKSENGYVSKDKFCEAVEELFYRLKAFTRKFIAGIILEVLLSIASVIAFILTEDMRLPMVLIDKWTPLMLILMIGSLLVDFILTRYKKSKKDKDEETGISLSE
ncbi:MAG: sortase [Lachnospiraceae bacterium]|nr:sortase [Lachnospiraceae bacterium]MBR5066917.1 sortase [Lachnospiraceae bacterium]MBR5918094.1 sortase [Lachnospiraceae bacterium]